MKSRPRARVALAICGLALAGSALSARDSLFSSPEPMVLRINAPFADLFAGAKRQPDYSVQGTLAETAGGRELPERPVRISLRGHTSRRDTECAFPKLKIEFSDGGGGGDGSTIGSRKSLKIGTHCGEEPGERLTSRFGRLPNEKSPLREAAVYRLLAALDVPALHARAARITYQDSAQSEGGGAAEPLVRHAMLLEGDDEAIERLGGTNEIEAQKFTSADLVFATADAATLAFGQALVGNFDWCVKFTPDDTYRCDARMKLWNVTAAARGGAKAVPVMNDLDLAGMVTGSHLWFANVYNESFLPSGSRPDLEVIGQLQRTRSLFSREELDAVRRRFAAKKGAAYGVLEQAPNDPEGRRQMRAYLDAFYREIESDDLFYRPVVARAGTVARSDAGSAAPAVCPSRAQIPIGTPVSEPLDTRGSMIRVVVLDALWHWAPPTRCPAMQRDAVWIEATAVSRSYP